MAKKTVIWSENAEYELKNVISYYNTRNQSADYGYKIWNEVWEITELLSDNEFMGRLSNDKKTRVIVMGVYLIFYEIVADEIHILSFWDNRQNPEKRMDNM